jgi:hypothetical protein
VWRSGHAVAVALPAGALIGEAVLLTPEWSGSAAHAVLGAELAAGALLPLVLVRRVGALPVALACTALAAVALGLAESEVRDLLRGAGWRGL